MRCKCRKIKYKNRVSACVRFGGADSPERAGEIEWREQENKTKVRCKYCSRLFLADKLRDHNKYWCGPAAERTAKQRKTDKKSDTQSINLGVTRTKIFLGLELRCF